MRPAFWNDVEWQRWQDDVAAERRGASNPVKESSVEPKRCVRCERWSLGSLRQVEGVWVCTNERACGRRQERYGARQRQE